MKKQSLSVYLKNNYFNQVLFEEHYKNYPNLIKNDLSLLYKSIHLDNLDAFKWFSDKVNCSAGIMDIISYIINKKSFNFLDILMEQHKDIFSRQEINLEFFKFLIKGYSWIKQEDRIRHDKLIKKILKKGLFLDDKFLLEKILKHKDLHYIVLNYLENGVVPFDKDNFFAEYCKNGSSDGVKIFKKLNCNMHYLNDLALINAAEGKNEEMVRFLIEQEKANPYVGNYYIFFSLLHKDDYSEKDECSDEMIVFLANLIRNSECVPRRVMRILKTHKKFSTILNYFTIDSKISNKKANEPTKTLLKI